MRIAKTLLLTLGVAAVAAPAFSAAPVVLFSDLIDGPRTGGENNKGAYVCVWGKNFGATRGTSFITLGGVPVDNYKVWEDPTPRLPGMNISRACFQIQNSQGTVQPGSQPIAVSTSAGTSNTLPFTVRPDAPDAVYCVDAVNGADSADGHFPNSPGSNHKCWASPTRAVLNLPQSAIAYVRQQPAAYYDNITITFTKTNFSGTATAYAGLIAYPGETVRLGDTTNQAIYKFTGNSYFVLANFTVFGGFNDYNNAYDRVIGNDLSGPESYGVIYSEAWGLTQAGSAGGHMSIYGNYIHDNGSLRVQYLLTGLADNSTFTFVNQSYHSSTVRTDTSGGATASHYQVQLTTTGGTPPGCTPASTSCVGGRLVTGWPYQYGTRFWMVNPGANTLQLCPESANKYSCTPITITDMGTGTTVLRETVYNNQPHSIYIARDKDYVDMGWNDFQNNWIQRDIHVNQENTVSSACSPVCGQYILNPPNPPGGIYAQGPALSVTPGGGLPARSYRINWTYETPWGETVPSHVTTYNVPSNNLLTVGSPTQSDAVWNCCAVGNQYGYGVSFSADTGTNATIVDCLVSVEVNSSGIATATVKNGNDTKRNQSCLWGTHHISSYDPVLAVGSPFGIIRQPGLNGKFKVLSISPDQTQMTWDTGGAPQQTITGGNMAIVLFGDYAWNVYVSTNGSDDWDGWKQNSAPILNGTPWTEPASGIQTATSHPPSRLGTEPGTVAQTGGSGIAHPFKHISVHDNLEYHAMDQWLMAHVDPYYGDVRVFNNVIIGMGGQICLASANAAINGPMPIGIMEFYNNTCYDVGGMEAATGTTSSGMVGLINQLHTPTYARYRNNILYVNSASVRPQNYVFSQQNGGYPDQSWIIGSNNIFYGNPAAESQLSTTSLLSGRNDGKKAIFADPGLMNPSGKDMHIASSSSAVYRAGVDTGLPGQSRDFDGVLRPQGISPDIGAYQYDSGYTPPPPSACDLNYDGVVNGLDVQEAINEALGLSPCTSTVQQPGQCSVIGVQRVINASLGGACSTGQ